MSDQTLPIEFAKTMEFTIPAFEKRPDIHLDMTAIYQGETRMVEAMVVNPAIYGSLEILFTQGESQARKLVATVGYELAQAKKILRVVESELILDKWLDFKKDNKMTDNATNRNAFLNNDEKYLNSQDRIDMLIALETLIDGKVKIFQEARRHMRKQVDMLLRGIAFEKHTS